MPVKSTATNGSSPITQASCPGGTYPTSPGPNSSSLPSSILTLILPDITYVVCGTSQLLVLTMGFTHFSQLQPGSKYALPMLVFPTFANSILPFSNVLVSSGEVMLFFCILFEVSIEK